MIKLRTDSRTPTLTPEQFASMRDALYIFLGGDALAYMGRIAVNDFLQESEIPEHNHDDLYASIEHNHPQYLEDINWDDIANKPNTYPPEAHEHPEYEGGGAEFPVGMLSMFGGSTAPSKWLLCNGAAVSRTTYADLFTAISTTYGVGDGTTTFNLPDLRGRAPIGAGQGSGLTDRTLGSSLGEEAHVLTSGENGPHTHGLPVSGSGSGTGAMLFSSGQKKDTQASGSSGSGSAHNNIQPSLVVNFIIYTGVE